MDATEPVRLLIFLSFAGLNYSGLMRGTIKKAHLAMNILGLLNQHTDNEVDKNMLFL